MSGLSTLAGRVARRLDALGPEEFADEADRPDSIVVDVREAEERVATGSIAHAIHVPRGTLEFRADPAGADFDPRLDHTARVLVYCSDGARAALAAVTLVELGYRDVGYLRGGLELWTMACLPLVGRLPSPY